MFGFGAIKGFFDDLENLITTGTAFAKDWIKTGSFTDAVANIFKNTANKAVTDFQTGVAELAGQANDLAGQANDLGGDMQNLLAQARANRPNTTPTTGGTDHSRADNPSHGNVPGSSGNTAQVG